MRPRTLILLGSLYLSQGAPYGFFTQALPALLRSQGLALPLIGLTSLLQLPWALKFVWAPYVDRVARRTAIIPLQLAAIVVLAVLGIASSVEGVGALAVSVLLISAVSATQDIATDGLAVEVLTDRERGLGNGLQVGAYRVGMVLGGGVTLLVLSHLGWTTALLALAGLLAVATVPIAVHREVPRPARPDEPFLAALRGAAARLGAGWFVVLASYKAGEWFASGMLRTFLTDAGKSLGDLATMLGFAGFTAALAGALVGGTLTTRLGRRSALIGFGVLQSAAVGAIALAVVFPSDGAFYAVLIAEHFTSSMATAALFTVMMDRCRPDHAGVDYTIQASVVVIASGLASALSGYSAQAFGYAGHFVLAAAFSLAAAIATTGVAGRVSSPRSPGR